MGNNVTQISSERCCGCRACADNCATGAITFHIDEEGFLQPFVDETKCVKCNKCLKVCPVDNVSLNAASEFCYAGYATESNNRAMGSSGGVFGCLTELAFEENYVIYGAELDSKLHCRHAIATNSAELGPLLKSKYIQSNTNGVYRDIHKRLNDGEKVVFCGTPCQCNALKNTIGNHHEHLLLIDFVCHGVPSQDLFDKCIAWFENKKHVKINSFQFRYKGVGVKHPQSYKITYIDKKGRNKSLVGLHYQYPYYFAFQTHISLRRSCYSCPFAKHERCSDITLGDFWGIEKLNLGLNVNEGVSMICPNTEKGKSWCYKLIAEGKIASKTIPYEFAINNNSCLSSPTMMPKSREDFFIDLRTEDFSKVINAYMKSKRQWIFDFYYAIPTPIRKIVRKVADKYVKYE